MNSKIAVAFGLAAILTAALMVPFSTTVYAQTSTEVIIPQGAQSPSATVFYDPDPVTVKEGATIIWTNKDNALHTATSGVGATGTPDGKFDSGFISPNQSSQPITMPSEEGSYPYYCQLHPFMVGTVIVSEEGENGGPATGEFKTTATLDGNSYEVTGKSSTSKATAAEIDSGKSVGVTFDKAGEVELTLPKSMISGISAVMADDEEVTYTTVSENDNSTTIKFTVPEGSTEVDIMGTFVVPEFPVVVALILAASMVAIIGYTRFARSSGSTTGFFGRA